MPGMRSGLNTTNPVLVQAFRSALMHQGLAALLVLAALAIIWVSIREWRPGLAASFRVRSAGGTADDRQEPAARRVVRIGFGLVWIFDGILQAQPAMAAGLPSKVLAPAAATSPQWVKDLVNWSGTAWSYHPIQASASAVWIQVGIGIWMVSAARGPWSRLSGVAGAGWGLAVWIFGEAFGGIFAPGLTALFGAPGAALCYCLAGVLVALPESSWQSARLGRWLLSGLGAFFLGMAVLQSWPGRGFWQGTTHGRPATLTSMIGQMAQTPQPSALAHLVSDFGSFTATHGFGVNAFAVAALALIGIGLLSRRKELLLPVVIAASVFCLADWVLVEDMGFFGGLGTDPNSMIPLLLLVACGYVAVTRAAPATVTAPRVRWREDMRPARIAGGFAATSAAGVLALWAAGVVLLGAGPMALAQANPNADPIIARALGGSSAPLNIPAYNFSLTDQNGHPVSLASLRGKVILMTFLDPVCTTDCPLIAQELRAADQLLGANASRVRIIAVAANPLYYTRPYLQAFDRQERLTHLSNWLYLTGPLPDLRKTWSEYGVTVQVLPSGQMIGHNDLVFVVDGRGVLRNEIDADPGDGTQSSKSSFAVEFTQAAEQALADHGSSS